MECKQETNQKPGSIGNDISITENIDFGSIVLHETHRLEVFMVNHGKEKQTFIGLKYINVAGLSLHLSTEDDIDIPKSRKTQVKGQSIDEILCPHINLDPLEAKILPINFKPEYAGEISISVEFCFLGFNISRTINASALEGLSYYTIPAVNNKSPPDQAPAKAKKRKKSDCKEWQTLPDRFAKYPPDLKQCTVAGTSNKDIEHLIPELAQPLNLLNYQKKLSTLVFAEELQMEMEMREFDMKCVRLSKFGEFLSLDVTVAEGRPSLFIGDTVIVIFTEDGPASPAYEGIIKEVNPESILLKFNENFQNNYASESLDIEFHFNRTPIKREHKAIRQAQKMEKVVFPTSIPSKCSLVTLKNNRITPFNTFLDERQVTAVSRIVTGCGRPAPYILFGPPGTGKTSTVVESILQIFTHIKQSRILVCAPSNSAADRIAELLHDSGLLMTSDMIRIVSFQKRSAVPEIIEQYCSKECDDLRKLLRLGRIIVMTCTMSGCLHAHGLKAGHFTHIFVDEAGQATEPQSLIPVGFAGGRHNTECQIVLAGDPFQLGAVLCTGIAENYGLGISLLERLMSNKLYVRNEELYGDCGNYNPLLITKLVNNYRSHPSLLKVSSSMFYDCELIPSVENEMVKLCIGSDFLPNPNVPLIFHGLRSKDERNEDSPSFFNGMEALQVLNYVQLLLKTFGGKIDANDIGIITPYRRQVDTIRTLLWKVNLSGIKVGSVEEFQGQERLFVIISTVRSNNLGFLSNPKRFNVSITRAQALLIVIGNPAALCRDPYWCVILQYAVMTGSYTGCNLPPLNPLPHGLLQELTPHGSNVCPPFFQEPLWLET